MATEAEKQAWSKNKDALVAVRALFDQTEKGRRPWPEKYSGLYPRWICSGCDQYYHMPWVYCDCHDEHERTDEPQGDTVDEISRLKAFRACVLDWQEQRKPDEYATPQLLLNYLIAAAETAYLRGDYIVPGGTVGGSDET